MHRIRLLLALPLYLLARSSSLVETIFYDVERAVRPLDMATGSRPLDLSPAALFWFRLEGFSKPTLRSVMYLRLFYAGGWQAMVMRLCRRIWREATAFEMDCRDIGPGLVINHGYGSVVYAKKIGADCAIFQGVTIGSNHGDFPTLGDGVYVAPGAKILGGLTVGNGAVVGANAVVTRDVAQNTIVGGVPARALGVSQEPWLLRNDASPELAARHNKT